MTGGAVRPSHVEPDVSDRGFASMPAIRGTFAGNSTSDEIFVQESSAASGPHLYLTANGEMVHLTAEDAWRLADQIRTLVANHYQGDATPEWATSASHQPRRDSDVAAWIKRHRDAFHQTQGREWGALDDLLDTYRLHADTGTPLDQEVQGPTYPGEE